MDDPSKPILVKRATTRDIPQLCALLSLLFEQESDFVPDVELQSRGLQLILDQPETGQVFCAEREGRIVGMVSILFSVSTAEGGRVAWLEDMIVHPDARGSGIGERLLRVAIAGAKEAGCLRITLLTDLTNSQAMEFYSRSGFARSQMVPMRLKL